VDPSSGYRYYVAEQIPSGPRDTVVPSEWRTEIGWPIFRLAPD
jgi:hypothetical protein